MSAALRFDPERTIVSYLAKHPETRGLYAQDPHMVEAMAHFFAKRDVSYIQLNTGVALAQYNAKQKNKIPEERIAEIQSKFTAALNDCKEHKQFPEATPSNTRTIHNLSQEADLQITRRLDAIAIVYASRLEKRLTPVATPSNTPIGDVRFPTREEIIVSYLERHPRTCDQYLQPKKMMEAVAEFFAKRPLDHLAVDTGIALTLFEQKQKVKIPEERMILIHGNFVAALRDCANRKPIPNAKL